jgi:hypothetical protein
VRPGMVVATRWSPSGAALRSSSGSVIDRVRCCSGPRCGPATRWRG